MVRGVEDVAVYVHKAGEASKLSQRCKTGRGVKDLLDDFAVLEGDTQDGSPNQPSGPLAAVGGTPRENDIEENLQQHQMLLQQQQQQLQHACLMDASLHGVTTTATPPDQDSSQCGDLSSSVGPVQDFHCGTSPPRQSGVDQLTSAPSECSESGYQESVRSSDCGGVRRCWRNPSGGTNGGSIGGLDDSGITPEQESLEQQVTMLKLRLDQATKTIQAERDEKMVLHRDSSRWQADAQELRSRLEDIKASRQEAVKELVALRSHHQKEVQSLQLEMLDEASSRECIDRR